MLRDNLAGLIAPMRNSAGADPPALGIQNQRQASDDRSLCLKNPRPVGTESSLTENVTSPFQAEPGQHDNYDFRFIREEDVNGHHCYVLELLPRRNAKNLLHGNIWVDAKTYLLHRVEGEPVRSSSWWLRDVRIVLLFGYVGEMWMQTSSESTADVRIVGQYKMISQVVSYQINRPSPVRSSAQAAFFPDAEPESPIP
jgi:hypothetical protein